MTDKQHSKSFRNNNPGNLRWGLFAQRHGAIEAGGFAKFKTAAQGLAAMVDLLTSPPYRVLTVRGIIDRYAPSEDNNRPHEYAGYILERSKVDPGKTLAEMDPFEIIKVVEAMIRFEGWK